MQQTVKAAKFPSIEELKERAAEEKKRINLLSIAAAVLGTLCLVAFIMYGRQQTINDGLVAARKTGGVSAVSEQDKALEKYKNDAFLYKIYSDNKDDFRATHSSQLMQTGRAELGDLEAESDKIDEALGLR